MHRIITWLHFHNALMTVAACCQDSWKEMECMQSEVDSLCFLFWFKSFFGREEMLLIYWTFSFNSESSSGFVLVLLWHQAKLNQSLVVSCLKEKKQEHLVGAECECGDIREKYLLCGLIIIFISIFTPLQGQTEGAVCDVPCVCVLAVMLGITAVSATCVKMKYKKRGKQDVASIVVPNMAAT